MPVGVTWGQYISFSIAAMISMLVGSQVVHGYYRPLQNLNDYIEKEITYLPEHLQEKIKRELRDEGILK